MSGSIRIWISGLLGKIEVFGAYHSDSWLLAPDSFLTPLDAHLDTRSRYRCSLSLFACGHPEAPALGNAPDNPAQSPGASRHLGGGVDGHMERLPAEQGAWIEALLTEHQQQLPVEQRTVRAQTTAMLTHLFTQEDWQAFADTAAKGMSQGILQVREQEGVSSFSLCK